MPADYGCPVRAAQLPVHAAKPTDAMTDRRDAEAGDDNADKLAPDPVLIGRTQERRSRSCAETPQKPHCENPDGVGAHTRRKGIDSVSETSEREACTLLDTPERKSEDLPWILRSRSHRRLEWSRTKGPAKAAATPWLLKQQEQVNWLWTRIDATEKPCSQMQWPLAENPTQETSPASAVAAAPVASAMEARQVR